MGFEETQTNGWFQLAIFNWELHCSLLNFFLDINVFLSTNCELKRFPFSPLPFLFCCCCWPQEKTKTKNQQKAQWLGMVGALKDFSLACAFLYLIQLL